LESWNLDVDVAQNALEVISHCARYYDLLLVDADMPGLCGQELVKRIRENDKYSASFPIFVVSRNAGPDMSQSGASEILTRPLRFVQVYQTLKRYLNIK
jgi:CheY-like chemotaxis protein